LKLLSGSMARLRCFKAWVGLGLGSGLFAAALVFNKPLKDVYNFIQDKADLGKQEWEDENLAMGDMDTPGTYLYDDNKKGRGARQRRYDDMVARTGQTPNYQEWEAANYDQPAQTYLDWADAKRAKETQRRRTLISILLPGYSIVGGLQYGWKDWVKGKK